MVKMLSDLATSKGNQAVMVVMLSTGPRKKAQASVELTSSCASRDRSANPALYPYSIGSALLSLLRPPA